MSSAVPIRKTEPTKLSKSDRQNKNHIQGINQRNITKSVPGHRTAKGKKYYSDYSEAVYHLGHMWFLRLRF